MCVHEGNCFKLQVFKDRLVFFVIMTRMVKPVLTKCHTEEPLTSWLYSCKRSLFTFECYLGVICETYQPAGLSDLNQTDLNQWFKSWFKSRQKILKKSQFMIFLVFYIFLTNLHVKTYMAINRCQSVFRVGSGDNVYLSIGLIAIKWLQVLW